VGRVVARRLKWKLIYQGHTDAKEIPTGALTVTRQQFARELRDRLPKGMRDIVFESMWRPRSLGLSTR